ARNERFREGNVFRRVFERVVEACIAAGLVGGEGFAVDASLIQADANKQRSIAGQDWRRDRDPARSSRAVKEYLATLDDTAWGAASDGVPKFISPSNPGSVHRVAWELSKECQGRRAKAAALNERPNGTTGSTRLLQQ